MTVNTGINPSYPPSKDYHRDAGDIRLGGEKKDDGKLPWDLLPIAATEGMLAVLQFGAKKYAPHNWRKGFAYSRLISSAYRHLAAIARGEDTDPESGLPHVDHLACCVAFLSEHMKLNLGSDDRYKYPNKSIPF